MVRDILVPVAPVENVQQKLQRVIVEKPASPSKDLLESACASFFQNYSQSNHFFMPERFPPLDIFTPDDHQTINVLVEHLEEYRRKQTPFVHEFESLRQQYFNRIKETSEEMDKVKEERDEYRNRLDSKERDQNKIDYKIKALEKVINTNSYRGGASAINKENRPHFATPSRTGSGDRLHHHQGTVSGGVYRNDHVANGHPSSLSNDRPSTISVQKTPVSSTFRSDGTPMQSSSYSRSRVNHGSSVTQSINRFQKQHQDSLLPPHTPNREGVPVANKRNQRRSKSAEMWLDHKPPNTAKIETVMQPKFSRKKSVSKIELNDAKKSSKYVLTHQQQDQNGEVVTNLIKVSNFQSFGFFSS